MAFITNIAESNFRYTQVEEDGRVSTVVDWKSDFAPSPGDRTSYLAQLSDYLAATGADRGAIVYMTLGEVVWLRAPASLVS